MVDRRLGRGLDFFLTGGRGAQSAARGPEPQPQTLESPLDVVSLVEVGRLSPNPYQPRKDMAEDELKQLAESIRASGILQPILARRVAGDRLEIVAGERRWRAATLAGLAQVPVLVRDLSERESAVFALVENLQREDLNAIEKAKGFKLLMTKLGSTQDEVARQVGLERSTVANFLRLLDLPESVQAHVSRGTLSMGHGRALLALPDGALMSACAEAAIRDSLSVRALEARVKELQEVAKGAAATKATGSRARPVWLNELEESLVEALGAPVSIRYGRKRSQIVIDCGSREEFERIFQRLKQA